MQQNPNWEYSKYIEKNKLNLFTDVIIRILLFRSSCAQGSFEFPKFVHEFSETDFSVCVFNVCSWSKKNFSYAIFGTNENFRERWLFLWSSLRFFGKHGFTRFWHGELKNTKKNVLFGLFVFSVNFMFFLLKYLDKLLCFMRKRLTCVLFCQNIIWLNEN